jgi:ATP-binding cassette subfamily F protein uup
LGNIVVDLEDAGVNVGTKGSPRWLFRHLTLTLRPGQCTGIVGRNGVGKTTLLKLCLGQIQPTEGSAVTGKRVKVNYIDQTRMQLDGTGSLLDEISDGNEKLMFGNTPLGARNYLRRFLFDDKRINERVDLLSGGERARLMLAKVLKNGGNVIVLDEPTNDLDLETLDLLEEMLADYPGTVILVSHDRDFLDRICTSVVVSDGDGTWLEYAGGYTDMVAQRGYGVRPRAVTPPAAPVPSPAVVAPPAERKAPRRKLNFNEQHALKTLPATIDKLGAAIARLEAELADPSLYARDPRRFDTVSRDLAKVREELAAAEEEWLRLELLREELGA